MDKSVIRAFAAAGLAGAVLTAVSGIAVEAVVKPESDVPDTMWSYPWSSDALAPVSIVYAGFHLLVLLGMIAVARSVSRRAARTGATLAVIGTLVLLLAEFASIPFADQRADDTGPQIVGGTFAFGVVLTAVGLTIAGVSIVRSGLWDGWRRYVALAAGVWNFVLIGLTMTSALPAAVAIYGVALSLLFLAVYTTPTQPADRPSRLRAHVEQ